MEVDPNWFEIFSDLLVNLAAGWFGAVLIVPNFLGAGQSFKFVVLTGDLFAGMLSLVAAFRLKKLTKEKL